MWRRYFCNCSACLYIFCFCYILVMNMDEYSSGFYVLNFEFYISDIYREVLTACEVVFLQYFHRWRVRSTLYCIYNNPPGQRTLVDCKFLNHTNYSITQYSPYCVDLVLCNVFSFLSWRNIKWNVDRHGRTNWTGPNQNLQHLGRKKQCLGTFVRGIWTPYDICAYLRTWDLYTQWCA